MLATGDVLERSRTPFETVELEPFTVKGKSAPVTPSFDPAIGQFIYTWQTQKAWGGTCRRLHLVLLDGSIHDADFQFK